MNIAYAYNQSNDYMKREKIYSAHLKSRFLIVSVLLLHSV